MLIFLQYENQFQKVTHTEPPTSFFSCSSSSSNTNQMNEQDSFTLILNLKDLLPGQLLPYIENDVVHKLYFLQHLCLTNQQCSALQILPHKYYCYLELLCRN